MLEHSAVQHGGVEGAEPIRYISPFAGLPHRLDDGYPVDVIDIVVSCDLKKETRELATLEIKCGPAEMPRDVNSADLDNRMYRVSQVDAERSYVWVHAHYGTVLSRSARRSRRSSRCWRRSANRSSVGARRPIS